MYQKSLAALVLLSLGSGVLAVSASRPALKSGTPASKPTSRPSIDLADLQREWDATLRQVSRARFNAGDHFDATPTGKAAKSEVAARRKALAEARALGSPQDRLEASSAYNKARAERDAARDKAIATDPEVLRALAAADRAKAELDRGKAALGIEENLVVPVAVAPPDPPVRPEYRVESRKTFGGMRAINVTFTVVSDAKQVESVLRSELLSSIDKEPPSADIIIYALDDNGNRLTTPDGSTGMVFVEAEGAIVSLKDWAAHRRRP